jgi:putative lipoprotein
MILRCYPLVLLACLMGCGGSEVRGSEQQLAGYRPDPRPLGKTMVYECTGYEFIARLGPGEMAVWLRDRYVILSQVRSASGIRYEEGAIAFWSKGEEAVLELGGQRFSDCQLAPGRAPWEDARRRGVAFRAVGNEPGWYLEIQRGRHLLFVGEYGMQRVMIPDPVEERAGPTRVYHAIGDSHDLRVEVVDELCADTMKGDSFPSQVLVYLNDKTYWGCGRDLDYPWE